LPSESHYRAVTERNLFSPDRVGFLPEETEPAPETELIKIPGKKITLYGVILTEDSATALVTNPEMKFGERRTIWVKSGDQLGSLNVTLIEKESISLTDGKKKYKILLYDQSKRKGRKAVAKKEEPTVVMTKSKQTKPKESKQAKPEEPKQAKPEKQTHKELTNEQYEIINTPFGKMKRRKK